MRPRLDEIVQRVAANQGLRRKRDIAGVLEALALHDAPIRVGDDCAAIPDDDGFLLLAIEGFVNAFVEADPFFAGYCGVMVNLSDIAAMGGRAIALVDALWARGAAEANPVLAGMRAAARRYNVPIVGGHTNHLERREQLAVAVLGRAKRLITSFDAAPGDVLLAAVDLRGRFRDPHPYWDASSGAPAERLRADLALLPELAEAELVHAGKDISMAGFLGTAIMLLEASGHGATITLDTVPVPDGCDLARFLCAFPSFGFLLAAPPSAAEAVTAAFRHRDIACATIGQVDASREIRLRLGGEVATLWNVDEPLVGCGPNHLAENV